MPSSIDITALVQHLGQQQQERERQREQILLEQILEQMRNARIVNTGGSPGGTKLYHQTDAATANIILRTQHMKPGSSGLAGGGIYFATSAEHTNHKAHRHGVILKATVALGKILTLDHGDGSMTLQKLKLMGYDSVMIPRAGKEYVVYEPSRVKHIVRADGLSCLSSAGSCLSCIFGFFTPDDGQVKHFRGPSADCCKPLARCCCVSADGEAIFGCVPTEPNYNLPVGLHMALCPQLGCDPKGGLSFEDKHFRGPCACCCKPLAQSCCCVSADGEAIFGCVPTEPNYLLPACLHMALCPQLGCDPKGGREDLGCMDLCVLTSSVFLCCFGYVASFPSWVYGTVFFDAFYSSYHFLWSDFGRCSFFFSFWFSFL